MQRRTGAAVTPRNLRVAVCAVLCGGMQASPVVKSRAEVRIDRGPHRGLHRILSESSCQIPAKEGTQSRLMAGVEASPRTALRYGLYPGPPMRVGLAVPRFRSPSPGVLSLFVAFERDPRGRAGAMLYKVFTIPPQLRDKIESMDDALEPTGRGDVKIDTGRDAVVVTFWGETSEGIRLEGTIECRLR